MTTSNQDIQRLRELWEKPNHTASETCEMINLSNKYMPTLLAAYEERDALATENRRLREVATAIIEWAQPVHHYAGFCGVCGADEEEDEHRHPECPVKLAQAALTPAAEGE